MRIAVLTLSFWPKRAGMEFVVHDLSCYLHKQGHEIFLFAPNVRGVYQEIVHKYSLIRFGVTLPGAYRYGLNRFVLLYHVWKLHKNKKFDIISVHSAHLATSYALDLKKVLGIPVVVTCHGHDIQRFPEIGYGYRLNDSKNKLICRNLKAVDRVVAISTSMYKDLQEIIINEKIEHIPNGVELPILNKNKGKSLRRKLGIEAGIIVLSVGRNVPKKAFDVGLRAFAIVARELVDVYYVHVGKDSSSLKNLSYELGLGDRFFCMGAVERDEVLSIYNEVDIFFSPAIVESFGLVTFEAMFAGLPCVLSDGPGNRDAILDKVNGFIVSVGDVKSMADAIIKLSQNSNLRTKFGRASTNIANKEFAWSDVAQRYNKVFTDIINKTMP